MDDNLITEQIIGCAIKVHRNLGPGLLESTYQECLAYELLGLGLRVEREKYLPINYDELIIPNAYRIDLIVENQVVVEIKTVEAILETHHAQVLTYMKLGNFPLGLLINFNVSLLKNGLKRFIRSSKYDDLS